MELKNVKLAENLGSGYMFVYDKKSIKKTAESENRQIVDFTIENAPFYLEMYKKENHWYPGRVYHNSNTVLCPMCETEEFRGNVCMGFSESLPEWFEKIKNHPHIRFKLVFE